MITISVVGLLVMPLHEVYDWTFKVLWRGIAASFVAPLPGSLVLGASIRFIYPALRRRSGKGLFLMVGATLFMVEKAGDIAVWYVGANAAGQE